VRASKLRGALIFRGGCARVGTTPAGSWRFCEIGRDQPARRAADLRPVQQDNLIPLRLGGGVSDAQDASVPQQMRPALAF
jgi:hypothetical protein